MDSVLKLFWGYKNSETRLKILTHHAHYMKYFSLFIVTPLYHINVDSIFISMTTVVIDTDGHHIVFYLMCVFSLFRKKRSLISRSFVLV